MRVLLIDDDPKFSRFASIALEEAGIEHATAGDAEQGLAALRSGARFDLVLLDIEMPGASGWDVLLQIRASGDEVPVVFVTGRDTVQERVKGLRMGADDYLVKPVEFDELLARIEAVVRRRRSLPTLEFGDLRLDLARRKVERGGQRADLSPREYDLLLALVDAEGEVVSRETLLREVWDLNFDPGTNVVEVHIGRLRRKLDHLGRSLIQTERGQGYRVLRHDAESA